MAEVLREAVIAPGSVVARPMVTNDTGWQVNGYGTTGYSTGTMGWNGGYTTASTGTTNVYAAFDILSQTIRYVTADAQAFRGVWQEQYELEQQARIEHHRLNEEARTRARKLLLSRLDPHQARRYRREGTFFVRPESGNVYKIRVAPARVDLMRPNGQVVYEPPPPNAPLRLMVPYRNFCIHPDVGLPHEDLALAWKLLLENDEPEFLRIANHYDAHGARVPREELIAA